jgi:hypothetical protein
MKGGIGLIQDTLPKTQPGTEFRLLHISHFIQKCKKGKPQK